MTLAGFLAALEGYVAAHAPRAEEPSDEDFAAALAEEMAAGRA